MLRRGILNEKEDEVWVGRSRMQYGNDEVGRRKQKASSSMMRVKNAPRLLCLLLYTITQVIILTNHHLITATINLSFPNTMIAAFVSD